MTKKLFLFILFAFFLSFPSITNAQDFKSDYQVEYYLSEEEDYLPTKVIFNIKITNLRSDVYVKKFSLGFPKNFIIHNIKASDD